MLEKLLQWDHDLLVYFNNLGSAKSDIFWFITTNFITWVPLFIFLIIHLKRSYSKQELKWIFLSFLSMLLLLITTIFICKDFVGRLRPVNDASLSHMLRIITKPNDFSFFSGHAASSFSIITLVFLYLRKKLKWVGFLFIWPILFSMSRVYLGVHYPSDIIVGCMVGIFFGVVFYGMHRKFSAPYIL